MMYTAEALAAEQGYSVECALDVLYLRSRNRHTPALEAELISLHAAGTPPEMCDFGVTPETQKALLQQALAELNAHGISIKGYKA